MRGPRRGRANAATTIGGPLTARGGRIARADVRERSATPRYGAHMIASDAGRPASPPPPPPPPGPSFLRRHPLLAGFGVLAALSLFAAYWPASAIVTGVVVAARASGADRAALSFLERSARRVLGRLRNGPGDGPGAQGSAPEPPVPAEPPVAAPEPAPVAITPPAPSPVTTTPPAPSSGAHPAPRPRRTRPALRKPERSAQQAGMDVER